MKRKSNDLSEFSEEPFIFEEPEGISPSPKGPREKNSKPRRRRRGGCLLTGCLILCIPLCLVLGLVGWVAGVQTGWFYDIGILKSSDEKLLGGAPNYEAAQALKAELVNAGFSEAGLEVVVLPVKDRGYNMAAILMDASQGFQGTGSADLILEGMQDLATSSSAGEYSIGRVAAHYYDASGRKLLSLTAPTADIQAFTSGQMDRRSFLKAVEGDLDINILLGGTP